MPITYWHIEESLKRAAKDDYRTAFALRLKNKSYLDIIRELTFDGAAPRITVSDIERLFTFIEEKILGRRLNGVGIEAGAGPAVFSAILAKRSDIERMYAVEVCAPLIEELMSPVVLAIAGTQGEKVIGCIGDFNHLDTPDQSIDFIFEFFSFHHSLDISLTMKECYRVLKPDGLIVMLDKARPDFYTDADINTMLDKEYEDSYKQQFGIPLTKRLTRRENGEHEYRLQEWRAAFRSTGLQQLEHFRLEKTVSNNLLGRGIKNLLALLPPRLQVFFTRFIPHSTRLFDLAWENVVFSNTLNHFRKEMSLIIAYK